MDLAHVACQGLEMVLELAGWEVAGWEVAALDLELEQEG